MSYALEHGRGVRQTPLHATLRAWRCGPGLFEGGNSSSAPRIAAADAGSRYFHSLGPALVALVELS